MPLLMFGITGSAKTYEKRYSMCTLLVTSNPNHISHAFSSPSFMLRGTKQSTLWALDFYKQEAIEQITPREYSSKQISPHEIATWAGSDKDDTTERLYILHTHSPTGDTWGRHPATLDISRALHNGKTSQIEVSAKLWHNGQLINHPSDEWDTYTLLKNLVPMSEEDIDPEAPFGSVIDWDYLNRVEGTFAGALYVDIASQHPKLPSQSRLFLFRNSMAPLIVKEPQSGIRATNNHAHPTEDIFLDSNAYISSVPLSGDESGSGAQGTNIVNLSVNTVYQVDPFNQMSYSVPGVFPVFALQPAAYFANVYDPYGLL